SPLGDIVVDNNGNFGWGTTFRGPVTLPGNLAIRHGGAVGPSAGAAGTHLTVTGNVNVENGGYISATMRGNGTASGPGAGARTPNGYGNGGSYGGEGGRGANGQTVAADCYGSITQPSDLGSGGGLDTGAAGGGALRLTVTGTLMVNGVI